MLDVRSSSRCTSEPFPQRRCEPSLVVSRLRGRAARTSVPRLYESGALSFARAQFSFSNKRFFRLPHACAPPTCLFFNVEVNLCRGPVRGYLLAVQFHF